MNISQVIHPEILFGTRGNRHIVELYKSVMKNIEMADDFNFKFTESFIGTEDYNKISAATDKKSKEFINSLGLQKVFKEKRGNIFYLPKSFCDALIQVDRSLELEFLPETFMGYFVLPKDEHFAEDGEFSINGLYAYLKKVEDGGQVVARLYLIYSLNGMLHDEPGVNELYYEFDLIRGFTITESFERAKAEGKYNQPYIDFQLDEKYFDLAINAILYVFHESDQIYALRSGHNQSHGKVRQLRDEGNGYLNLCTLNMKLINFQTHREREYGIDKTIVRGHYRWMRVGLGRVNLKLKWIQEHQRSYSNVS